MRHQSAEQCSEIYRTWRGDRIGSCSSTGCREQCRLSVSISDTGIGIAEEDILRLFQPFVRLVSSQKTTVPGTGLGLYLTRKLVVDVLGGDIICKSDVGVGSSFTLIIPERIYEKGTGSRG